MLNNRLLAEMGGVLQRLFAAGDNSGSRMKEQKEEKLDALEGMVGKLTKLVTGMAHELTETKESGNSALNILKSWQIAGEGVDDYADYGVLERVEEVVEPVKPRIMSTRMSRGRKRKVRSEGISESMKKEEKVDGFDETSTTYQKV